jgi:hypothetical protein
VLKDSVARGREAPSPTKSSAAKRVALLSAGVLTPNPAFGSPSSAAEVVSGKSANGRIAWRLEDGRTLADVEEDEALSDRSAGPTTTN